MTSRKTWGQRSGATSIELHGAGGHPIQMIASRHAMIWADEAATLVSLRPRPETGWAGPSRRRASVSARSPALEEGREGPRARAGEPSAPTR